MKTKPVSSFKMRPAEDNLDEENGKASDILPKRLLI
jgi:hypothetical protein